MCWGCAAVAWPFAARAQQPERMKRIGVLMFYADSDHEGQKRVAAFREELQKLGWEEGRNIQIEYHWYMGDVEKAQASAARISTTCARCDRIKWSCWVREIATSDAHNTNRVHPVARGFVQSLAHPGKPASSLRWIAC